MIRIVISDAHKVFSKALHNVLSSVPNFQVTCICSGSDATVDMVRSEHPQIVFLDMTGEPAAIVATIKKITAVTKAKVIALSTHLDPPYANRMLQAGAMGYLTKNASLEELITAVNEVVAGNIYTCTESKAALSVAPPSPVTIRNSLPSIRATTREFLQTVENHWHHILKFSN